MGVATDWAPVVVGTVLFILLTPGFLFQVPARGQGRRFMQFMNMQTSGPSIAVHAVIYFVLIVIILIVLHFKIYFYHHHHHHA